MNRTSAEILALEALGWIAETGVLPDLLDNSGIDLGDLQAQANSPDVLESILEFLLSRDELTKTFCDHRGIEPSSLHAARYALSGGVIRD
jgi:hypothetical protein